MLIGELGRRCGVSTRALRHYENLGLLRPARSGNGYREYDETAVRAVDELRSLTDLGFSLTQAKPFLDCLQAGNEISGSCTDSLTEYRLKLAEIDAYLTRLQQIRARLAADYEAALATRHTPPGCEFSAPIQAR